MKAQSFYQSQSARDAEASNFGDVFYWDYLDKSAIEMRDRFLARGDSETAEYVMTRSIGEALRGNDGD